MEKSITLQDAEPIFRSISRNSFIMTVNIPTYATYWYHMSLNAKCFVVTIVYYDPMFFS